MFKNLSGIKQPRSVVVIDSFTGENRTYESLRACARAEKIAPTTLYKAIKNKTKLNRREFIYGEKTY